MIIFLRRVNKYRCNFRLENNSSEECIQALRNLVLLVGSMTSCGYIELKPLSASSGALFQMPNFSVPQPTGKGKYGIILFSHYFIIF